MQQAENADKNSFPNNEDESLLKGKNHRPGPTADLQMPSALSVKGADGHGNAQAIER